VTVTITVTVTTIATSRCTRNKRIWSRKRVRNIEEDKSKGVPLTLPPHLELTKKQPYTYSPAEWTTRAAPKRMMDATTIENHAHHPKITQKKIRFILPFFYLY
jgi:hypothetical protein